MNSKEKKSISKFLSLVLRHNPELIGIEIDENGWVSIEELRVKSLERGMHFTREDLIEIVETNDKKRFSLNLEEERIRANQGHSIKVNLNLESRMPPLHLYHGTAARNETSIRKKGIERRSRQHVHLSVDEQTAIMVGSRHGKPIVLRILAQEMHKEGYVFYVSENGVWLIEHVPPRFIDEAY